MSTQMPTIALVHGAFAESAFQLSTRFPGSTLGEALDARTLAAGGIEFATAP